MLLILLLCGVASGKVFFKNTQVLPFPDVLEFVEMTTATLWPGTLLFQNTSTPQNWSYFEQPHLVIEKSGYVMFLFQMTLSTTQKSFTVSIGGAHWATALVSGTCSQPCSHQFISAIKPPRYYRHGKYHLNLRDAQPETGSLTVIHFTRIDL